MTKTFWISILLAFLLGALSLFCVQLLWKKLNPDFSVPPKETRITIVDRPPTEEEIRGSGEAPPPPDSRIVFAPETDVEPSPIPLLLPPALRPIPPVSAETNRDSLTVGALGPTLLFPFTILPDSGGIESRGADLIIRTYNPNTLVWTFDRYEREYKRARILGAGMGITQDGTYVFLQYGIRSGRFELWGGPSYGPNFGPGLLGGIQVRL